jgi:predicted unusual protein kinase regulating ubiquinone biosynthesis (AarF/ABC1/UbiB family)
VNKTLSWQKRKSSLIRQFEIFTVAGQLLLIRGWDKLQEKNSSQQRQKRAIWLVQQLIHLGPTFIKIGQAMSTRPDLIPLEYVQEFSKLQDQVPEFSSQEAIAVIESELNNSLFGLYQEFEATPLASASLGQVHKARLYTGEDVVVKVQRPGLENLFKLDFKVLKELINLANFWIPWVRKYQLKEIYQEFLLYYIKKLTIFMKDIMQIDFERIFVMILALLSPKFTGVILLKKF